MILAKTGSLKLVLDARYLNSLVDEPKCNRPIEPIQMILTKKTGSAYNQLSLDEKSRRLTQFVIRNQQ